jgi:fucose 4-O-acetylase-like acetyltransferase
LQATVVSHMMLHELKSWIEMSIRSSWVDYAKGIGILLVVYGHVARGLYNAGISVSEKTYLLIDSIIYSFHMPLFFFLSGIFFVGSFNSRGATRLVLSKVDSIFYPFVIWSIFQGCIEATLSNYTSGTVSFTEVFSLLWEPSAQFWFLYALFLIFAFVAITYSFVPSKYTFIVFVASFLILLKRDLFPGWVIITFIAQNLVYFTFGMLFSQLKNLRLLENTYSMLIILICSCILQYYMHMSLGTENPNMSLYLFINAVTSILFIVAFSLLLSRIRINFIFELGRYSMSIYLMHILLGGGVRVGLQKVFDVNNYFIHLTTGIIVGTVGAILIARIIEKYNISYIFSAPISKFFISIK